MKLTRIPPAVYSVRLGNVNVPYTIRRSPRAKHLRITISAHDGVVLTYPTRLRRYINPDEFIREKQDWVLRNLERIGYDQNNAELVDGATLHFRGHELRLRVRYDRQAHGRVVVDDRGIHIWVADGADDEIKRLLREFYREQAAAAINREAERQAARIGVRYNRLAVRDQKTKWGSCSRKRNLSFNWRLILFPPEILRYIVIHELCHLRHFDHSPAFWSLVERHAPNYRHSVKWLREHGGRLEGPLR